jgi:hypothetical protein
VLDRALLELKFYDYSGVPLNNDSLNLKACIGQALRMLTPVASFQLFELWF